MAIKRHVVDHGYLGEITLLIDYTYNKGRPSDGVNPPDYPEVIINSVCLENGQRLDNILLSRLQDDDDLWQEIHELETIDAAADAADYYNDLKRDEAYEEDLRKTGAWE